MSFAITLKLKKVIKGFRVDAVILPQTQGIKEAVRMPGAMLYSVATITEQTRKLSPNNLEVTIIKEDY